MRKIIVLSIFILLAIANWAQSAPSDSPTQGQPPATAEGQPGQQHRPPGVAGTITAVNADSIVVKAMDGRTVQVNLSDKTRYRKDRQAATLADFKVGDPVLVRGEPVGDNVWQADVVAGRPAGAGPSEQFFRDGLGKRFILGEIKSVSGTQLAIERPDGVTQTITVDENTSFQKDGESITLADLKPGDRVFGRGEIKNNIFVPAVLNLGDPRMMWQGRGPGPGQGTGQGKPESR
jgi:hypothetical protein